MEEEMKAKEYAEKWLASVNPDSSDEEVGKAMELVFYGFITEFRETVRKRNVKENAGFVAVYDEFENKWDAMVTAIERVLSLTPEIGIDIPNREAFSVLFEALSPELYTSIQVVKRQIKNEKQKQEERRTWWKHEHS
jgi:hypothetical protein